MSMLDEGAGDFDALQLADRAERLGAQLGAGAVVARVRTQLYVRRAPAPSPRG